MWFNYVLLYTLHLNEENGLSFFVLHTTMALGKGKLLGGQGPGVGGDVAGNLWTTLTKPYGVHFSKQDTRVQRTKQPSSLFLCVRGSSLLPMKTEQRGVKQRYSCEMAVDLEVNG